jgi:hypothetical protein
MNTTNERIAHMAKEITIAFADKIGPTDRGNFTQSLANNVSTFYEQVYATIKRVADTEE